ncbi:MAG: DUF2062 domain-containing protein [Acidobacteriota bacterium]
MRYHTCVAGRHGQRRHGVWQSLGRFVRYRLIIPVFRSPHAPEHSARGVANGVFWALTPLIGFQVAATLVTWFVARTLFRKDSSLLLAGLWNLVNNPVTFLPLYYLFYVTGAWLTGTGGVEGGYASFAAVWDDSGADTQWERLVTAIRRMGAALLVGCLPYAVAGSVLGYLWTWALVNQRQRRRAREATRRAHDAV